MAVPYGFLELFSLRAPGIKGVYTPLIVIVKDRSENACSKVRIFCLESRLNLYCNYVIRTINTPLWRRISWCTSTCKNWNCECVNAARFPCSENGLMIHNINPEGRVANTSVIAINDVIIEINGRSLLHANFTRWVLWKTVTEKVWCSYLTFMIFCC